MTDESEIDASIAQLRAMSRDQLHSLDYLIQAMLNERDRADCSCPVVAAAIGQTRAQSYGKFSLSPDPVKATRDWLIRQGGTPFTNCKKVVDAAIQAAAKGKAKS